MDSGHHPDPRGLCTERGEGGRPAVACAGGGRAGEGVRWLAGPGKGGRAHSWASGKQIGRNWGLGKGVGWGEMGWGDVQTCQKPQPPTAPPLALTLDLGHLGIPSALPNPVHVPARPRSWDASARSPKDHTPHVAPDPPTLPSPLLPAVRLSAPQTETQHGLTSCRCWAQGRPTRTGPTHQHTNQCPVSQRRDLTQKGPCPGRGQDRQV